MTDSHPGPAFERLQLRPFPPPRAPEPETGEPVPAMAQREPTAPERPAVPPPAPLHTPEPGPAVHSEPPARTSTPRITVPPPVATGGPTAWGNSAARDLIQNYTVVNGDLPERRPWRTDWRNRDSLATEAQTTVPPDSADDLVATLTADRFVLLASPRKAGQRTTARYLVHRLIESGGAPETLSAVRVLFEDNDASLVEAVAAHPDAALIIDLTEDDEVIGNVYRELDVIGASLAEAGSFLILILPEDTGPVSSDRWPVHRLSTPDGHEVFRVTAESAIPPAVVDELLADPWLTGELDGAAAPTASWLARAARDLYGSDTEPASILAGLTDVSGDWRDRLEAEIGDNSDAEVRSLIMAAAMFPNQRAGVITAAADELQSVTKTDRGTHPLCQTSPHRRLRELAEFGFDADQCVFLRPGYGAAVMPYFWSTFVALRPHLLKWWIRLMTRSDERVVNLEATVSAVIEVTSKVGVPAKWIASRLLTAPEGAREITEAAAKRRRKAAAALLGAAAVDNAQGRSTRRTLWEWARNGNRDRRLAVAEVCGMEYGRRYPQNALTRIKHLLKGDDEAVRAAAAKSLGRIASDIGVTRMVSVMAAWNSDPDAVRSTLTDLVSKPETVQYIATAANGPRLWGRLFDLLDYDMKPLVADVLAQLAQQPKDRQECVIGDLVAAVADVQRRYDVLLHAANFDRECQDPTVAHLHGRVLTGLHRLGAPTLRQLEARS